MVRAFVFLAGLPVLPFRPGDRLDIVPVDYVADAIATLHVKERPEHEIYHLSAGAGSETYRAVTDKLAAAQQKRPPIFLPSLERPFTAGVNLFSNRREGAIGYGASLLKVFLPYLVWNTVFDNTRVVRELGRKPAPFSSYCHPLLRFSREHQFRYPYREWPGGQGERRP